VKLFCQLARTLVFAGLLTASARLATADTIQTFDLSMSFGGTSSNGVTGSPFSLTGTVTIDTTIGSVTSEQFYFGPWDIKSQGLESASYLVSSGDFIYTLDLLFPTASLVGYSGGSLVSSSNPDKGNYTNMSKAVFSHGRHPGPDVFYLDYPLLSGQLTPTAAAAPEPGGLIAAQFMLLAWSALTLLAKRVEASVFEDGRVRNFRILGKYMRDLRNRQPPRRSLGGAKAI